jgi:hypothetical protein
MDGSDSDTSSLLDLQVHDAKLQYILATEALCEQVEDDKRVYHQATDEHRQAAQERYIKSLNALNDLVAAAGTPKQFEAAEAHGGNEPAPK